jgi:hypothetical protein
MVKQKHRAVDIMETIKSNTTLSDHPNDLKKDVTPAQVSGINELQDLDIISSKFLFSKYRKAEAKEPNANSNNNSNITTNGNHKVDLLDCKNISVSPSASPDSMELISDNEETKAPSPTNCPLSTSVSNNHLKINNNIVKSLEKNNLSPTSSYRSDYSNSSKKNVSFDLFKNYTDKALKKNHCK